jgi:hypothetical protein
MLQSKLWWQLPFWRVLGGVLRPPSPAHREVFQWIHPQSRCEILWTSE